MMFAAIYQEKMTLPLDSVGGKRKIANRASDQPLDSRHQANNAV